MFDVKEWLTPDGLAVIAMVITLLLSLAKNVADLFGKKELATKLGEAQTKAATAARVAGTVMKGVERVKREGKLEPKAITQLVETLREENLAAGIEEVVKPILAEVRVAPATPPEVVVQRVTAKLDPKTVARRVS